MKRRMSFALMAASLTVLAACTAEQQAASEVMVGGESSSLPEVMEKQSSSAAASSPQGAVSSQEASSMPEEAMMKVQVQASAQAQADVKGTYASYHSGVVGNGHTSVLFFHAAWCPVCRTEDKKLSAWYESQSFPITTYKVDYDAETELKQRYGVTYQHTFVKIDGEGNVVKKIQGPTEAELQALLSA